MALIARLAAPVLTLALVSTPVASTASAPTKRPARPLRLTPGPSEAPPRGGRSTSGTSATGPWSPDGVLVLDTIPHAAELFGTDDVVVTFACWPAAGTCRRLPGNVISEGTPYLPSDAFGQFLDYLPAD